MIPDIAQGKVIEGYSDENIDGYVEGDVLEQLKRLPPEWRQNAMAEYTRRTTTTVYPPSRYRYDGSGFELEKGMIVSKKGSEHITLKSVVDETLEQIGQKS